MMITQSGSELQEPLANVLRNVPMVLAMGTDRLYLLAKDIDDNYETHFANIAARDEGSVVFKKGAYSIVLWIIEHGEFGTEITVWIY